MKKFLCYFFIGYSLLTLQAQELQINQEYIDTIPTSPRFSKEYKQIKSALEHNKQLKGWTKYYMHKSFTALRNRVNDSALYYANRSIKAFDSLVEDRSLIIEVVHQAYYIKGLREYFDGKIEQSLKTLNIALTYPNKISELIQEISWRSLILERITIIHFEKGDYQLSLDTKKRLLLDTLFMSGKYEGGNTFLNIGNIFKDYLQELDSAKIYYYKALKKYENPTDKEFKYRTVEAFYSNVVAVYNNLGDTYYIQENQDSTLYYYSKVWEEFNFKKLQGKVGSGLTEFFVQANYAYILFSQDSLNKAIQVLEIVRDTLKVNDDYNRNERNLRLKTHDFLSQVYQKKGEYDKAIAAQKELNDYLVEYNEQNISKQLQLFTTQYEVQEKDNSIAQLEETTENQQTIIKQRGVIGWILGGLLLSFVGLGYLFYRQRQLQNKYKAANLEQRLLRSQLNPHFLFNALSTVSGLAQKNSKQTVPYISKLGRLLRSVLENSREEFISLEEELETVESYLELQSNFSHKFQYDIKIDEAINQEEVLIPPMFIQPFIENAIEHGFKGITDGKITINIQQNKTDKTLHLEIADNGVGYSISLADKEKIAGHKSLSGTILKERLVLYAKAFKTKASYTINDLQQGTQVDLHLPYILDC